MITFNKAAGYIITTEEDNRDYYVMTSMARDDHDLIDRTYRMIYKDSDGMLQIRKFLISVRYADGMVMDICGNNDRTIFGFLAKNEHIAKSFVIFMSFGKDFSFVIPDYDDPSINQAVSKNVIVYINPIQ